MVKQKIVCIGSKDAGTKNDARALAQSLQTQGLTASLQVCYWEDMVFTITSDELRIIDEVRDFDLADATLVVAMNWYKSGNLGYYRDVAFALALYLQKAGTEFWNSEMLQQRSTTKLSVLLQLAQADIPIPKTIFSLDRATLISKVSDMGLAFPIVVKTIAGSRGVSNHLVQDVVQLHQLLTTDVTTPYMIEEYIPNDHDLRIICYGGEPSLVIRRSRISDQTHLNNTSKGATAELLSISEIDEDILRVCRKACKLLGREMAGVDIVLANDGSKRMVCLEVNAIPQITSGSHTAEKSARLAAALNDYLKGKV